MSIRGKSVIQSTFTPIRHAPNIRAGTHEGRLQARVIGRAESLPGPSWLLLLLLEGEAEFTGPGPSEKAQAPALLWRPWIPGHGVRLSPGTVAAHIVAGANAIANAIGHKPESQDVRELLNHAVTTTLDPATPIHETARACFIAVHRETREGGIAAATMIEAYLRILVVEIWRSHRAEGDTNSAGTYRSAPSQRIFNQFTALVEQHFRDRWTVERYAEALGLSRDRLGDVCQRTRGRSPKTIIDRRTLREAQLLLETSTSSVEQIAGRLGFQTASQFNRFFRRLAGQPPGRARRSQGGHDGMTTEIESAPLHDWP
ncbi:helix-turn-helix transcriptional regulator [Ovoidimarina sediminis]|uniref:helix-turn-helix transcriptional regulator n=1 Tax=Ovoidimarina sediminis TaxID=3079856 RepID=UPI002910975F|nr:AraC family transcriptional regulator [Rhodophyticola sp. MJ-SS7]MDU8944673.1 AraC family transcriptional regulator [Rhodophyticola sp. MJ-SS7]